MVIESNAKINIGLNIIERLPNGYHNLDMTMVPISLADKLTIDFKNKKGKLKITSNIESIPTDESNILYKVYKRFYERLQVEPEEVSIYLEKHIPHEAGLGGGSSNGGFFLRELNKFHNLPFTDEELMDIGKKVGADIPFFIKNKPCRVQGIGEKLIEIENNLDCDIILIKPKFGVSTKEAYEMYGRLDNKKFANIDKIVEALKENNLKEVITYNENMLEQGLLISNKNIQNFREKSYKMGEVNLFMSGSGSCYYILCEKEVTSKCIDMLLKTFNDCYIIKCNFL